MTQKLTNMEIDRVDLVDGGANGRRFALFKRDGDDEEAGLIERFAKRVADLIRLPEPVAKAMTFAQIVAGREITTALEENWWVLQDSLWSAIYAVDDDGAALSLDAKKQLVAQNLDEFKAFLLDRMDAGIDKSAGPAMPRLIGALVAKVGRTASPAHVARIQKAADALTAVLAEVAVDEESAPTEKRATAQEETNVDKTELEEVLKAQLDPITERLEKLEKGEPEQPAAPVSKGDGEGDDAVTLEGIASAVGALGERIEKIETQRGERTSGSGEEAAVTKSKGQWAGLL